MVSVVANAGKNKLVVANNTLKNTRHHFFNSSNPYVGMGSFFSAFVLNEKNRRFKRKKQNLKKQRKNVFFLQIFILIIVLQAIYTDYSILDAYLKSILRLFIPYKCIFHKS